MKTRISLHLFLSSIVILSSGFAPQTQSRSMTHLSTIRMMNPSNPEWARAENDDRQSEWAKLDISQTIYTSSMKAPKDAYIAFAEKGAANAKMSKHKIFHQSLMGGAYVGFGGLLALCIAGNLGGVGTLNPAIPKFAFAALFPVNLLLVITTGGQLFTGNTATVAAAKYEGLVEWREFGKALLMSLLGNIAGCSLFALAASYCGVVNGGAAAMAKSMAVAKCATPFGQTFVKAILCNWMVTLAVFLSGAANDLTGKIVGCWFPISTFVGIGLEHSVANMFLFPAALMAGASLTFADAIWKNLLPVCLGNLVAGSLIVAASYSYQFGNLGKYRRNLFLAKQAKYEEKVAERKRRYAIMSNKPGRVDKVVAKVASFF